MRLTRLILLTNLGCCYFILLHTLFFQFTDVILSWFQKFDAIFVSRLLQGLCDEQLGARLVFRGRLVHHTLQRPRRPAIPETLPPHQEHPHPTVEGTGSDIFIPGHPCSISKTADDALSHAHKHYSHFNLRCFNLFLVAHFHVGYCRINLMPPKPPQDLMHNLFCLCLPQFICTVMYHKVFLSQCQKGTSLRPL